jgi:hypothetical protein
MNLTSFFGLFQPSSNGKTTITSPRKEGRFFRPLLESLEGREVPSASPMAPPALNAAVIAQVNTNLLQITDIDVTNIAVTGANSLLATLNVSGTILGQAFTLPNVQVPINLTPDLSGAIPILHLSLEIEDLNVLGLHVELNNCDEGPITVDINAIPSTLPGGGLLGDLLGGLSGILGGPTGLLGLAGTDLTGFTGAIEQVLDGVFDQLLGGGVGTASHTPGHQNGGGHQCDLVDLQLGPINLNVLGLQVLTSPICLEVYAVRGNPNQGGGLLGNLLCGLDGLLGTNASDNAINNRVGRIIGVLTGL